MDKTTTAASPAETLDDEKIAQGGKCRNCSSHNNRNDSSNAGRPERHNDAIGKISRNDNSKSNDSDNTGGPSDLDNADHLGNHNDRNDRTNASNSNNDSSAGNPVNANADTNDPNDPDLMPEPADCCGGGSSVSGPEGGHGASEGNSRDGSHAGHGGHGGHHHRRGLAVLLPQPHHHHGGKSGSMSGMAGMESMSDKAGKPTHASPRIVFVGNPNVGKSTLFNAVLGASATVMNAPGTTVLVESGSLERDGERWDFIDTPGTASLDAYSPDEQVAGEAAMGRRSYARPDIIVFTFNATSPSKSYYLLSQLMDLGFPIIIAVTMLDLAEKQDSPVTLKRLKRTLPGIPMVRVDGRTSYGKAELLDTIAATLTEIRAQEAEQTSEQSNSSSNTSARLHTTNDEKRRPNSLEIGGSQLNSIQGNPDGNIRADLDKDAIDRVHNAEKPNRNKKSQPTDKPGLNPLQNKDKQPTTDVISRQIPKKTDSNANTHRATVEPSSQNPPETAKETISEAAHKASEVVETTLAKAENATPTLDGGGADVSREIHVQLEPKPVTSIPAPPASATQEEVSQWVRETSDERFEWIAKKLKEINKDLPQGAVTTANRETFSDKLDRVLLHPAIGLVVFLITMFLVFEATTTLAGPLQDWFDVTLRGWCTDGIAWIFTAIAGKGSLDGWLYSLIVDGFLNGAITVCTFIPPMGIMFIILSLLEDSGYLARAAFVMDRAMRMVGLDGRAFLPLVVGFGCNLPALASTRTLPDSRQRLLTGLLIPFTSCSARLSVYVVLAYAFFGKYAGVAIFLMYVSSIAIILAVGFALRKTQFKDLKTQPFAMELPPYQMPRLLQLLKSVLQRLWSFITGASSVIVTMLIIVWVLSAIPISAGAAGTNSFGHVDKVENSVFGAVSTSIAPVFKPAGFDDWHASAALVTGFVAKEVVVGSLSQSYAINDSGNQTEQAEGQGSLGQAVHKSFEKSSDGHPNAAAAAFMIFILAYTPCLATVAEMKRQYGMETALQSVATGLIVAYILAIIVFQVGRLL